MYQTRSERNQAGLIDTYNNLFVKNFPRSDFTSEDLRQLFEPYGAISSCTVVEEKNFGFVCFEDPKAAVKAATTLHCDEEPSESPERVENKLYVKRAVKKEVRKG